MMLKYILKINIQSKAKMNEDTKRIFVIYLEKASVCTLTPTHAVVLYEIQPCGPVFEILRVRWREYMRII
jgi:hypothetical protein